MTARASATVSMRALRCEGCGTLAVVPRRLCGACHGAGLAAVEVPGTGRLASWTIIRRPPLRFQAHAPYAVCVVDLDCGLRATGRLVAFEADPAPGARVRCVGRDGDVGIFTEEER